MKTIKQISKIFLASILILSFTQVKADNERKESFEKTYKLDKTGKFNFSCYDTDLKINTWDKNEVKLTGEIIIDGGDKEDQDELINVFKNPEANESFKSLSIETNMAKNTIIIGPFKKITLVNGKTIKVDKYKATYTLWVPQSIALSLKSKYNNINIANLSGDVDFDLYDADLTLVSFGKKGKFKFKYCSVDIGSGDNAEFDVYDSDFEIKNLKVVSINSKYSGFNIGNMAMLTAISYDDDYTIQNISNFTCEAKYSDFKIYSNMEMASLNFYDSDFSAKDINSVKFSAKYSSFRIGNANVCEIPELYDSDVRLENVGSLNCNDSKYDEIEMESISKSIKLPSAYTLNLKVHKVESSFEEFTGEFKYGSVKLPLTEALEFNLNYETTYGSVIIPENKVKVKTNISDNSKHSFDGSTAENAKCTIQFTGYDIDFDFN